MRGGGFLRKKMTIERRIAVDNFLAVILGILFYGGMVSTIICVGLKLWSWFWRGLIIAIVALIVLAIMCISDNRSYNVKKRPTIRTMARGLSVLIEAVISLFIYFAVCPFIALGQKICDSVKKLVCEHER
mgnify:CR=1 FL=1